MQMASPDLEKQGFFAVVFVNREYNGQPYPWGMPKRNELKKLYEFTLLMFQVFDVNNRNSILTLLRQ
jgi:ssDNA-specific exonuclease RecJ